MKRLGRTTIYLACLSLMAFVGLYYDKISPAGLAAQTPDGPFFCKELLSY